MPEACTLPTVERPVRVAEFDRFFGQSVRAVRRVAPTRADLVFDGAAEAVARDLAAREGGCCSFFTFGFETGGADAVLRVGVPAAYVPVLDAFVARAESAVGGRG